MIEFRADKGVHLDENGNVVKWENQAMGDVIKPEDVPEDFIGTAEELFEEGHWSNNTKVNVARFLNAAIESGIVSPPVYCVRWGGELQILEQTDTPRLFPGKPWAHDQEHYKGQTS